MHTYRVNIKVSVIVYGTFPAWWPGEDALESLRASCSSSQWTQDSLLCSTCSNAEKLGLSWLKQHNFVIFRYVLTQPGGKMYIFPFNSCIKFHAKICMQILTKLTGRWLHFMFIRFVYLGGIVKICIYICKTHLGCYTHNVIFTLLLLLTLRWL